MFDTMTMTKAVGAVCGSLLAFLMIAWAGAAIFYMGSESHGEVAQAYVVETADAAPAEAEATVDFAEVLASADAAAGEKVFAKCKACHKVDGTDGTGPHLNGVVNRPKASVAGFAYSETLVGMSADAWSPENLSAFLENPKGYAPGTKMAFAGLSKVTDRANVIAWLETQP